MLLPRKPRSRAAAVLAILASLSAAAGEEALLRTGFEESPAGFRETWRRKGEAAFSVDEAEHRSGKKSARITVAPGTKLAWQQLQFDTTNVREGDTLRAIAWVRTRGIEGGYGAYFVLESLDAGGKRVACDHSRVSPANGKDRWDRLTISTVVREGTKTVRVGLVMNSHGSAWFDDIELTRTGHLESWPDMGDAPREVTVRARRPVSRRFGGVGFHVFHHTHNIPKRMLDEVAEHMKRFRATGTEIYLATWGPKDTSPGDERAAYARGVVDNLEYLVRDKGLTNIRYYCMTNELSLNGWGKLLGDLPKFRDYHRELHREISRRGLEIGLLASDASPIANWGSISWAAENMDDITEVYGGHHYINRRHPTDERFYPWFRDEVRRGVEVARSKGKDFILGEFGCKQDGRVIGGKKNDACIYWDTPTEPMVGIQLAEAAIAAMNAGVYAMGNWTFMDFPDDYSRTYANKWCVFKWSGGKETGRDTSTRAHYYAYGLLSKFFRGPAEVVEVETSDPRLRAAALRHRGSNTWSVAVVNRNARDAALRLSFEGLAPEEFALSARLRKYVYDPARVPQHPFGDLQEPERTVRMTGGRLADTVGAGCLVVYTSAFDDDAPARVRDLRVVATGNGTRLSWRASDEADLCYYRVYRSRRAGFEPTPETRIGSTVATEFADTSAGPAAQHQYAVVAVDTSGNARAPSRWHRGGIASTAEPGADDTLPWRTLFARTAVP
ncbi:MAG: hypothetical protein ACYTKD_00280 [Planctomycetota bacterium]|jgi:hypothetical protein